MTAREFLRVLIRRWYVLLALLAVSAAIVVVFIPRDPGVYWGRATVVFVPPTNPARLGNVLEGSDPSLIYFANAVSQVVNRGDQTARLSSTDATLYGSGVRQGRSVTLVNSGGQWLTNYNRPMLNVEVVDLTSEAAQSDLDAVLQEIATTANTMQRDAGAPTKDMIKTETSPALPQVDYVPGNWKRAVAAASLLGLGISLAATLLADRLMQAGAARRRRLAAHAS